MHREPADRDPHRRGREGLDLELAQLAAVERVRDVGAERFEVEVLGAVADLLVDRERDADRRLRRPSPSGEIGDRGHDLRDAGLVVGAEQRRAVAGDDVVPDPRGECRERLGSSIWRGSPGSGIGLRPGLVDDRRDARPGHVRRGVHVSDEADGRAATVPGRSRRRLRLFSSASARPIARSSSTSMPDSSRCFSVLGRRSARFAPWCRSGVAQEAFEDVGRQLLGELAGERAL